MLSRFIFSASIFLAVFSRIADAEEVQWRPIFNGRDFSGWETWLAAPLQSSSVPNAERDEKGNYTKPLGLNNDPLKVFAVEQIDGRPAIHVSGEGFGTLSTLESFSNYHLRFQFKWGKRKFGGANRPRNGGLLYHAYGNHGDVGGRWLHSHQYQIEEGGVADYIAVGDTAMAVKARRLDEKKRVYDLYGETMEFSTKGVEGGRVTRMGGQEEPLGEWNNAEVVCVGEECIHLLNGKVVLRGEKSRRLTADGRMILHTEGRLQFQIEGAEIYFRGVEICVADKLPADLALWETGTQK